MTKDQKLGQFRTLLTTLAGVLVAWGLNDGHGWMPVVGVLLATFSLVSGIRTHLDPDKPGGVAWSLVRKLINAGGAALVTYGFTTPEQAESVAYLMGALGPVVAGFLSFIDNDDETDLPVPPSGSGLVFLLLAATMFLSSCSLSFTPDGCVLFGKEHNGNRYEGGPCVGADQDGDGKADIDRFRVRWTAESGVRARGTYTLEPGTYLLEYETAEGLWLAWSSKSGVSIGPLPPEMEKAVKGQPEPLAPRAEPVEQPFDELTDFQAEERHPIGTAGPLPIDPRSGAGFHGWFTVPVRGLLVTGDHHEEDEIDREVPVAISIAEWRSLVSASGSYSEGHGFESRLRNHLRGCRSLPLNGRGLPLIPVIA